MYPRTVPLRIFLQEPHLGSNDSRWSRGDTAVKSAVLTVSPVVSLFRIFFFWIIFGNAKSYYVGMTVTNKSISLVIYIRVTNTPGLTRRKQNGHYSCVLHKVCCSYISYRLIITRGFERQREQKGNAGTCSVHPENKTLAANFASLAKFDLLQQCFSIDRLQYRLKMNSARKLNCNIKNND